MIWLVPYVGLSAKYCWRVHQKHEVALAHKYIVPLTEFCFRIFADVNKIINIPFIFNSCNCYMIFYTNTLQ